MTTAAYEFTGGEDRMYPWGVVHPGDIAFFTGRAPDGDWVPHVPATPAAAEETPAEGAELTGGGPELKRPGKADSASDWVAYAKAEGSFPGDPDTATRKAIVEHYTDDSGGAEQ